MAGKTGGKPALREFSLPPPRIILTGTDTKTGAFDSAWGPDNLKLLNPTESGNKPIQSSPAQFKIVSQATSSVHAIQVVAGLRAEDEIVVSDTTRWKSFERVMLK